MGFERGISYSKRLAPIYEDWAKFHNIEFLDAAKYANPSEIDACHLTRESHRKLGKMVAKKCKEILEIQRFRVVFKDAFLYNNNYMMPAVG